MSDRSKAASESNDPNRREVLLASTALMAASAIAMDEAAQAQIQPRPVPSEPPNIVYFLVDNLGYGELGCYGGGILRGADNTIVVFSGDNGPEEMEPWRGHPGLFDGSYFTGMEGSLRTPCLIRYPGRVAGGSQSNEVVHITDMFTTLAQVGWSECP